MATSSLVQSNKAKKRLESIKSHSWWWDSSIGPKNSKWLTENLEEMDRSVKKMIKLIEDDGDSFAKRAEMYYKNRPELMKHVEEVYRMYRSLAERYDHVTAELRKNAPSDLQLKGSDISDFGSEQLRSRRKAKVILHSTRIISRDSYRKEGDESSSSDTEPASDDSSVGGDMQEKLQCQQEDGNCVDHPASIARYEPELILANEKILISREKIEAELFKQISEVSHGSQAELESLMEKDVELHEAERDSGETSDLDTKKQELVEELRITKEKLKASEAETLSLKHEIVQLKADILERDDSIEDLIGGLVALESERDGLNTVIFKFKADLMCRDDQIDQMEKNLHDLRMEHLLLNANAERAYKLIWER